MATPSEMVTLITATLAGLYADKNASMSMEGRSYTRQDIPQLENSLRYWERKVVEAARASAGSGQLYQCKPTFKGMN